MRVVSQLGAFVAVAVVMGALAVAGESPAPAVERAAPAAKSDDAPLPSGDEVDNYARWAGRAKSELVTFWGRPHKIKRHGASSVLVYELRVTCDGIITGTQYSRIGKGVVTGSQDPLDSIENNVPQGATRRAGSRLAAEQTIRFFVDASGTVSHHEASRPRTNWKRCKY